MTNREIFTYELDGETRYADPYAVLKALHRGCAEIQRDFDELCRQSASGDIVAEYEPWQILQHVACEAFGLEPFDPKTGDGTLAADVDRILDSFLVFMQKKSATSDLRPT